MTKTNQKFLDYGSAILSGFEYLLETYPEVFVLGQGLWSPWYVGNSMTDLDKKFGALRVIDTPVSESVCTAAAVGASIVGMRPVIVHPRIDFMLYAMDSIVNQAAKWSHMFGGRSNAPVTVRGIINRGGEQGAQHSQALHSWFAHVPGLRVVMPATVEDARDLLVASVLCDDPVVFIDDRWLYSEKAELGPIREVDLRSQGPRVVSDGSDITIVGCGFSTLTALRAKEELLKGGANAEVIDLRVLNPFDSAVVAESVRRTGRLIVVDGAWRNCGMAAEVVAAVVEQVSFREFRSAPARITLPGAPAPASIALESQYYPKENSIVEIARNLLTSI